MLGLGNSLTAKRYSSGVWTPTNLGNKLIHWYKFNTGISTTVIDGGDQITSWEDQKGSNNAAPSVTNDKNKMAKLESDGSVRFNNTGDELIFSSTITLGKFAIYGRFRSSNFGDRLLQKTTGDEFIKFQTTTEFRIQTAIGTRHDMVVSGSLANNTKFTAGFERAANGDISAFANGNASSTSANTAISDTVVLGKMDADLTGTFDIFELIICDDVLSSADRTEINAYLNAL